MDIQGLDAAPEGRRMTRSASKGATATPPPPVKKERKSSAAATPSGKGRGRRSKKPVIEEPVESQDDNKVRPILFKKRCRLFYVVFPE